MIFRPAGPKVKILTFETIQEAQSILRYSSKNVFYEKAPFRVPSHFVAECCFAISSFVLADVFSTRFLQKIKTRI